MVSQAIEKLQAGALATDAVTAALVELEVFLFSFYVLFTIFEFTFLIFKWHTHAELVNYKSCNQCFPTNITKAL